MSYTYASVPSGLGNNVAVDSIGGTEFQLVKLDWGPYGSSIPASGSALYGLMVDVTRVQGAIQAAQSGAWSVGVNNFPSSFAVSNFPTTFGSTQSGAWSVSVTGTPNFSLSGTGSVAVTNWPSLFGVTQSGTWNVGLNAGSNAIGSVTVSNTVGVSGTITANAGTNLNTSALALESGGNLASIKGKTDNIDVLLSTRTKPSDQQHTILDSGSLTGALPAGSNLIGSVNVNNTAAVSGVVSVNTLTENRKVSLQGSLTITLASLANAAGRISTQVVHADQASTFKYPPAILISFKFKVGSSAPTAGSTVQFFLVRGASGVSGSHVDGNLATTDTGYTSGSSPFTAAQIRDQLQMVYASPVIATSGTAYQGSFYLYDPGPMWSLYAYNDTGQTLDSTGGNFYIRYEEVRGDFS